MIVLTIADLINSINLFSTVFTPCLIACPSLSGIWAFGPHPCPACKHIHKFELCSYGLCMAKRVLKMAIRCLLFDRWMSTMQLQSSVCQRIGNTVSFFCQHSMHIFIKIGRSGPYVSKMTTFCLYMAAGSVV